MGRTLGIDTSCYTTSIALVEGEKLVVQKRKLLTVALGERGLQQSEGVFQHVRNLPMLMEELQADVGEIKADVVCASDRPRDEENSYMPVFLVGAGAARTLTASLGIPLRLTSHQQGHVRAALTQSGLSGEQPFLAVHLSGGTTEVVKVKNMRTQLVGGSADLHAGQFVDRVGVALGLPFPAGPTLELLAVRGNSQSRLAGSVKGLECSFSGAESQAQRWIEQETLTPEDVAAEVYSCIARTLLKLICAASSQAGIRDVLVAGGVASSALLRTLAAQRVRDRRLPVRLYWGQPELSSDNAVGVAQIGAEWDKWNF